MKKRYLVFLAFMLVVALSLMGITGCGGDTGGDTGDNGEGAASPDEVIELKFSTWDSANDRLGKYFIEASDMIAEKTNGRIKVTNHFSSSLIAQEDQFTGVGAGVADISTNISGMYDDATVLHKLFSQVLFGLPYFMDTTYLYNELIETMPAFQEEMAKYNVRWLSVRAMEGSHLHFKSEKDVRLPEDLKGLKIATSGRRLDFVDSTGGVGVSVAPPDMYTSVDRGMADGVFNHWGFLETFGLIDLLPYHVQIGPGGAGMALLGVMINLDTWNSLTPEDQQIIQEAYHHALMLANEPHADLVKDDAVANKGHTVVELTDEEIEQFRVAAEPILELYFEETDKAGLPGREAYEELMRLAEKYR
jgi:C4-dicarboxylate-binding protein DctP